jgi:hypothetical protein
VTGAPYMHVAMVCLLLRAAVLAALEKLGMQSLTSWTLKKTSAHNSLFMSICYPVYVLLRPNPYRTVPVRTQPIPANTPPAPLTMTFHITFLVVKGSHPRSSHTVVMCVFYLISGTCSVSPCSAAEQRSGVCRSWKKPGSGNPLVYCRYALKADGDQCRSDSCGACDGVKATCAIGRVASKGTVCRPSAGPCDPAEVCDGKHHYTPSKPILFGVAGPKNT